MVLVVLFAALVVLTQGSAPQIGDFPEWDDWPRK
jgi:hypothetical protein